MQTNSKTQKHININYLLLVVLGAILVLFNFGLKTDSASASAACTPTSAATYGKVSDIKLDITSDGLYRITSRVKAPDATNNAYSLTVKDGAKVPIYCDIKVGNAAIPSNTWTWLDYKDGVSTNKVDLLLPVGTYYVDLVGVEPSVQVDRVLAIKDASCSPATTGDNCYTPLDTTPPVNTALSVPSTNISASATLSATSSDPESGISKIDFYAGTTLIGSDSSSPYSVSWNTANGSFPDGNYSLTARAYNGDGLYATSSAVSVIVKNQQDTTPPVNTALTVPASPIIGAVTLSAVSADTESGITKVDFYAGTTLIGSDPSSPYSVSWNTANGSFPDGSYSLTAKATNGVGLTATSTVVTATVQNRDITKPSTPTNLNVVAAASPTSVNLSWTGSTDNVGVTGYRVYRNSALLKTVTGTSTSDSNLVDGQTYSYYVVAQDAAGNLSSASNTVSYKVVVYVPPTVTISQPQGDTTVSGNVLVSANTTSTVTSVRFKVDGVDVYPDVSAPYGFTWDSTSVLNGAHSISADVYDVNSVLTDSDLILVTVANADTEAPKAPTNFTANEVNYNNVALSWGRPTDNVGVTGYLVARTNTLTGQYIWLTATTDPNATSFVDTSVQPSTSYRYDVAASDAAGNWSQAATVNVITPAKADITKPTAPTFLVATTASSTQINLAWTASTDDTGVTGYDVYRDGNVVASNVFTISYGDTGLTAGSTHSYYVVAKDAAGNVSDASNTVVQSTPNVVTAGSISGIVTKSTDGAPIWQVYVSYVLNGSRIRTRTAQNGSYTLSNIPEGNYQFKYAKSGWVAQYVPLDIVGGQNLVKNVVLVKVVK